MAAELIRSMHGNFRIPALIKCADHLARHGMDKGLSAMVGSAANRDDGSVPDPE